MKLQRQPLKKKYHILDSCVECRRHRHRLIPFLFVNFYYACCCCYCCFRLFHTWIYEWMSESQPLQQPLAGWIRQHRHQPSSSTLRWRSSLPSLLCFSTRERERERKKQREKRSCSGMQHNVYHAVVAVHVVLTSPKGIFIHSQVISLVLLLLLLLLFSTSLNLFRITSLVTRFRASTNIYVCVCVYMYVYLLLKTKAKKCCKLYFKFCSSFRSLHVKNYSSCLFIGFLILTSSSFFYSFLPFFFLP